MENRRNQSVQVKYHIIYYWLLFWDDWILLKFIRKTHYKNYPGAYMMEHYNTKASVKAVADYLGDINSFKEIMPEVETVKSLEVHGSNAKTYYLKVGTLVIL
jgi:hypothetical protein